MTGDHGPERLRGDRPHRPGLLPPGIHEEERGEGMDPVRTGDGRRVVDIHIHEPRAARVLPGERPQQGNEPPVRCAPLRIEVDHDRQRGADHLPVERGVGDADRTGRCGRTELPGRSNGAPALSPGYVPAPAPVSPRSDATNVAHPSPDLVPRLLAWFSASARPLPWRRDREPYHVWIAEVLLQQTRVAQAVPYYERFLERFPDLASLAASPLDPVLKTWQGAGYYARARHLHDAARTLVTAHEGRFPATVEGLEALPGVGPYIARAIASIAFGAPTIALEANGIRVAARWTLERGDVRSARVRDRLARALARLLNGRPAGPFNEAIMELGETICLPVRPRCELCPVARWCVAHRSLSDPGTLPRRSRRSPRPHFRASVVVLADRHGRWLVQRRPPTGLLGGLWEFPGGKIEPGETAEGAARRELHEETGIRSRGLDPIGVVRHAYSHFTVELHVFRGALARPAVGGLPAQRWIAPGELARLPVPKATEKVVRLLARAGPPSPGRGQDRRGAGGLSRSSARGPGRTPGSRTVAGGRRARRPGALRPRRPGSRGGG